MAHAVPPSPVNMMVMDGGGRFIENPSPNSRTSSGRRKMSMRESSSSSLEILPPEDQSEQDRSDGIACLNGFEGKRPTSSQRIDSATRRTPTPTKQVSLQAVRRKEESPENDFGFGHLNLGSDLKQSPENTKTSKSPHKHRCHAWSAEDKTNQSQKITESKETKKCCSHKTGTPSQVVEEKSVVKQTPKESKPADEILDPSEEFDTDLEDVQEGEEEEEEEEKIRAPNELMMEFLECMMSEDYTSAQKLCSMILLYEPDNMEAQNFKELIVQKVELDAAASEESDLSSSSETEDSDDSDLESGDSSSEEENESEEEGACGGSVLPDSGVSSTTDLL